MNDEIKEYYKLRNRINIFENRRLGKSTLSLILYNLLYNQMKQKLKEVKRK